MNYYNNIYTTEMSDEVLSDLYLHAALPEPSTLKLSTCG